jgi:hypothetical protein
MSLDMLAIADGLAARYSAANVTPPTGYTNIRNSTARLTNNLSAFPCVEVFPPGPGESELVYSGGQRRGEHSFTVRFYYGQSSGDLARDFVGLYSWMSVLIDQLHGQMKLGLAPTVTKAIVFTAGIGTGVFGGVEYALIELDVHVFTEDTVTFVP